MEHSKTYTIVESDLDELGHMNYLRYIKIFETARFGWFEQIGLRFENLLEEQLGPVLLKLETEYSKEVRLGDTVEIRSHLIRVGTKSFTLEQTMIHEGQTSATTTAIMAIMDLQKRKAIPVPAEIAKFKVNL
ncbi:acyl-CoA thioesterase [Ureibacillus acetophenoni]|uniref:Acyl-CoA thioester hydrolase n=1 Tax=Ureibacillus acetophenoni TaxID=614649 RepID=A0A285UQV6_9BACL|nr:thioesterase family protein [Ureibacillus acetophenoni]SOC44153.1 acyl-CoA thioester hydrolase [Ureibacillus acetophenoni]